MFEVTRIKIMKSMVKQGVPCVGCRVDDKDFVIYQFERTEETYKAYRQARRELGLDK